VTACVYKRTTPPATHAAAAHIADVAMDFAAAQFADQNSHNSQDAPESIAWATNLAKNYPSFLKIYEQHPIVKASTYRPEAGEDSSLNFHRTCALHVIYTAVHERHRVVVEDKELTDRHGAHAKTRPFMTMGSFEKHVKDEADRFSEGTKQPCTFDAIAALLYDLEHTTLSDSTTGLLTLGEQAVMKAMQEVYPKTHAALVENRTQIKNMRHHQVASARGWSSEVNTSGKTIEKLWDELKTAINYEHIDQIDKYIHSVDIKMYHPDLLPDAADDSDAKTARYLQLYYDALIFTGIGNDVDSSWYTTGVERHTLPAAETPKTQGPTHPAGLTMKQLQYDPQLQRSKLFSKAAYYFANLVQSLHGDEEPTWKIAKMFSEGTLCVGYPQFLDHAKIAGNIERKELLPFLSEKFSNWPISTVLSIATLCDEVKGTHFIYKLIAPDIPITNPSAPPVNEKWLGKINLFALFTQLVMAPPLIFQTCLINHFLAEDYAQFMDNDAGIASREHTAIVAVRKICHRTDPVGVATRISQYLSSAFNGPKSDTLIHPLFRQQFKGLPHWTPQDIGNMLGYVDGWQTPDVFPPSSTIFKRGQTGRQLIVALFNAWFPGGMNVNSQLHRAKALILSSANKVFVGYMGEAFKEMCATVQPADAVMTSGPVAPLPHVIFKAKPFVKFVRKMQRHCNTRRPLFTIKRREDPSISFAAKHQHMDYQISETPADPLAFNVLSRQYAVPSRYPMGFSSAIHPTADPFNQEDDQIDRNYKTEKGAQWNITRPFGRESLVPGSGGYPKAFMSTEGVHMTQDPDPTAFHSELEHLIERTTAVIWSESNKVVTIVGYVAADDSRDFFDVLTRALEVYMATGDPVQPSCIAIDQDLCSPLQTLEDIAGECADTL